MELGINQCLRQAALCVFFKGKSLIIILKKQILPEEMTNSLTHSFQYMATLNTGSVKIFGIHEVNSYDLHASIVGLSSACSCWPLLTCNDLSSSEKSTGSDAMAQVFMTGDMKNLWLY